MSLQSVETDCNNILSDIYLLPVQKMYGVNTIITKMFSKKDLGDESFGTDEDVTNLLTELANKIRIIVRESAWNGPDPISFKSAISQFHMSETLLAELEDSKWEMIESWINHDRDYNWNYLNLMQLNLLYNWKVNNHFGLSPQHYRMYAIFLTVMKQNKLDDPNHIDMNFLKNTYKSDQQIPMMIQRMLNKVLIHIQS